MTADRTHTRLFRRILMACLLLMLLEAADTPSQAATQGDLGSSSNGSVSISVTKSSMARISGLSDMTVSSWQQGQGDILMRNDVCVYSTRSQGGYLVRAQGSGAGGAFALSSSNGVLPYNVAWNAGGRGGLSDNGQALLPGQSSGALTHAATDSSTCNGANPGPTARLLVSIPGTSLSSVADANYSGTLTLIVVPN